MTFFLDGVLVTIKMNGEGCVTKVHIDARRYWKFPSKGCVIKVEKVPLNKTFEKES